MLKKSFLLLFILILQGCASMGEKMPVYQLHQGDRIGVIVDVDGKVTHTHVGTTVFNNFVKQYPDINWGLSNHISWQLKEKLSNAKFEYVDIASRGYSYSQVSDLIQSSYEGWKLNKDKEATFNQLSAKENLKAIVVIKEKEIVASLECSGGPCNERKTSSSGLYTRSMFFSTRYHPVASIETNIYLFQPIADLSKGAPLTGLKWQRALVLKGYQDPADFNNISASEWKPIEISVKEYLNRLTSAIINSLNNKTAN